MTTRDPRQRPAPRARDWTGWSRDFAGGNNSQRRQQPWEKDHKQGKHCWRLSLADPNGPSGQNSKPAPAKKNKKFSKQNSHKSKVSKLALD
jgi:hypothetical protein